MKVERITVHNLCCIKHLANQNYDLNLFLIEFESQNIIGSTRIQFSSRIPSQLISFFALIILILLCDICGSNGEPFQLLQRFAASHMFTKFNELNNSTIIISRKSTSLETAGQSKGCHAQFN